MKHADLIAKLEAATGPDRELDVEIALAFGLPQEFFGDGFSGIDGPDLHHDKATWSGRGKAWIAPSFTASIDAAIALVERLLPGRRVSFDGVLDLATVFYKHEGPSLPNWRNSWLPEDYGEHPNLAIALLIAALKAHGASHDA